MEKVYFMYHAEGTRKVRYVTVGTNTADGHQKVMDVAFKEFWRGKVGGYSLAEPPTQVQLNHPPVIEGTTLILRHRIGEDYAKLL